MTDFRSKDDDDDAGTGTGDGGLGFPFERRNSSRAGGFDTPTTPATDSATMTPSLVGSEAPLRQRLGRHNASSALSEEEGEAEGEAGHPGGETPPSDLEVGGGLDTTNTNAHAHAPKHLRWIPRPVWRAGVAVARWAHGPDPPRRYTITPLFPAVQGFPLRLARRLLPRSRDRKLATFALWAVWLVIFSVVKHQEERRAEIQGWGVPQDISCGATYWAAGNDCGIDGVECRPFDGGGVAFRCDAFCASYEVLNPRAVGTQEVVYAPLVIGGPPDGVDASDDGYDLSTAVYRGDSHICSAAIHAGVVSNAIGGCGVVRLAGTHANFTGSRRHGISSVAFDSYFPSSFVFGEAVECGALDNRWPLLGLSVSATVLLALWTASPAYFFWPAFVVLFWQTGMSSDPPPHSSTANLASTVLGRFLPAMLGAWALFDRGGVRTTLTGLTAQVEKAVLWLGGAWVSSLDNYTWSRVIPIQRLNAHDLQQQPGAKAALAIIIVILALAAVWQVWCFRNEGRLVRRLKFYALVLAGVLLALALPGLRLRVHHYVIGLVLIPGTAMQTRVSLLFQGLLLGWYINGLARWGFDSVLQTPAELLNDAQLGSALPDVLAPSISLGEKVTSTATAALATATAALSSITFRWGTPPSGGTYDGISVLVNDVERFRGYFSDGVDAWTWARNGSAGGVQFGVPEYFRFAYMSGTSTQDYTRAGTWGADGGWTHMQAGASKRAVKRGWGGEMRRINGGFKRGGEEGKDRRI